MNVPDLFVDLGTTPEIRPIASHLKEHLRLRSVETTAVRGGLLFMCSAVCYFVYDRSIA